MRVFHLSALGLALLLAGPAHAGNERTQRTRITTWQYQYRQALSNYQWQQWHQGAPHRLRQIEAANQAWRSWYEQHQTWGINSYGLWHRPTPYSGWLRHDWAPGLRQYIPNRRGQRTPVQR